MASRNFGAARHLILNQYPVIKNEIVCLPSCAWISKYQNSHEKCVVDIIPLHWHYVYSSWRWKVEYSQIESHIFKGCGVYFWRDFRCSNNFSIFSKTSFLLHFLHISLDYASHWREITTPVFSFIGLFFQALSLYTCSQVQKEEKHLYSFPENIKGKCSVCILQQTYWWSMVRYVVWWEAKIYLSILVDECDG